MSQQKLTVAEVIFGLDDLRGDAEVFVEVGDKKYVVTDVIGGSDFDGTLIGVILAEEKKEEDE
jgi:hypothetical protein